MNGGRDMKIEASVCDVAGCGVKGEEFEVRFPDGSLKADLCVEHAGGLADLRSQLPKSLFVRPGTRRKAMRIVVDPNAAP